MSMKNVPVADLELMTPGSLWLKEINGSTQVSTFLFFANQNVPKKFQKQVPVKAVFADAEGAIFALDVPDFIEDREFHSVHPDVEFNVENIFNPLQHSNREVTEEEAVPDEDSLLLDDDEDNEDGELAGEDDSVYLSGLEDDADGAPHQDLPEEASDSIGIVYHLTAPDQDAGEPISNSNLDPQEIANRTVSYEVLPSLDSDGEVRYIQHVLTIRSHEGLTAERLAEFFRPSDSPFYGAFSVQGRPTVDWDGYLGVFPAVTAGHDLLRVVLTTDLVLRAEAVVKHNDPTENDESPVVQPEDDVENTVERPAVEESPVTTITWGAAPEPVVTPTLNVTPSNL